LARLVVRLSRLAYAGIAVVVAGVAVGLCAHHWEAPAWMPYSRVLVGLGVVLYVVARWRSVRRERPYPPP